MAIGVSELKGVTAEIEAALHRFGIDDATQLLTATAYPRERAELAANLGIDARVLLEIANRADLARIRGLTCVYANLLAFAGVDTVMELRRRKPENLYAKLITIAARRHVQQLLRLDEVQRWVSEAKQLERAIYY